MKSGDKKPTCDVCGKRESVAHCCFHQKDLCQQCADSHNVNGKCDWAPAYPIRMHQSDQLTLRF